MENLAKSTASYRERKEDHKDVKERISAIIKSESVEFRAIRKENMTAYRRFLRFRAHVREFVSDLNPGQP
jgi:hypothetical protein